MTFLLYGLRVSTPRRERAVLEASEKVCLFFIERGGTDATAAEIAAGIGMNERTFYRYFATKADAVRPLLDQGAAIMADRIVDRPDLSIPDAVLSSFAEIVGGDVSERTRRLFPLIFGDSSLRAVLLCVYHDAEEELREAIASRRMVESDSVDGFLAAATLVGATRIALEVMVATGADPIEVLRRCFSLVPGRLIGGPGKGAMP